MAWFSNELKKRMDWQNPYLNRQTMPPKYSFMTEHVKKYLS
jgi:hypothetical protein